MNKVKLLTLFGLGILMTACSTSVDNSTTTHVKDLAQSDVFGVLPDSGPEVLVFQNNEDVIGEYLELATVRIQKTDHDKSLESMMEMLKDEARELGGNGVILVENSSNNKGSTVIKEVVAIAIYTLGEIPENDQLVLL